MIGLIASSITVGAVNGAATGLLLLTGLLLVAGEGEGTVGAVEIVDAVGFGEVGFGGGGGGGPRTTTGGVSWDEIVELLGGAGFDGFSGLRGISGADEAF